MSGKRCNRTDSSVPQYYKRAVYRQAPQRFEVGVLPPTKFGSFPPLVPAELSDQFQASHTVSDYEYILSSGIASLHFLAVPSQVTTYGDPGTTAFGYRTYWSFAMALSPVRSDNVYKQEKASRRTACTFMTAPLPSNPSLLARIRNPWRRPFTNTSQGSLNVGPYFAPPRQQSISAVKSSVLLSGRSLEKTYQCSSKSFGRIHSFGTFLATGDAITT